MDSFVGEERMSERWKGGSRRGRGSIVGGRGRSFEVNEAYEVGEGDLSDG
jgi:hypothetical protein